MKRLINELIARGIVGGMLAGLVVVLWFLAVDFFSGQPFHTPAALAAALSNQPLEAPSLRLVGTYTVVHFAVFAALGVAAMWALNALRLRPSLLLGVVFGMVVQECVFYAGLWLSGTAPSEIVSWIQVVGANLLSGIVLMGYLHRAARDEGPFGLSVLTSHPPLARGIVTGLIGATAVAVWFLIIDAIAGEPLRTPAALGTAVLFGEPHSDVGIAFGVVAVYTIMHVLAFVAAGILFVAMAEQVERSPSLLLLAGMAAIVLEAVAVTAMALGAEWVLGALGVWSILGGNVLAVACMGAYVWRTHPLLRRELRGEPLSIRI